MKHTTAILFTVVLGLVSSVSMASTFRCGSQVVSTGERAFQVLRKCGEPINRAHIGYKLDTNSYGHTHELRVEEWIYGPKGGMYYYLRFEGGYLTDISSSR